MQPLKWEFRSNIWYYMWKKNLISKRIHLNIQSGRSRQPDLRLTDHIWSKTESQKCSTFEACSWPCQKWGGRLNEIFPKARRSNALGETTRWLDDGGRDVLGGIFFFRVGHNEVHEDHLDVWIKIKFQLGDLSRPFGLVFSTNAFISIYERIRKFPLSIPF